MDRKCAVSPDGIQDCDAVKGAVFEFLGKFSRPEQPNGLRAKQWERVYVGRVKKVSEESL